jgi:hypothetical protein
MTAREIESRIEFTDQPGEDGHTIVEARITLSCYLRVSDAAAYPDDDWKQHARRECAEMLMRKIYEDQRERLYKALYDWRKVDPMDFKGINAATDNLLEAALRQQPNGEK